MREAETRSEWLVLRGPIAPKKFGSLLKSLASAQSLAFEERDFSVARVASPGKADSSATIRWRDYTPAGPNSQRHVPENDPWTEVLIEPRTASIEKWFATLLEQVTTHLNCYSTEEVAEIARSMPILERHSSPGNSFDRWCLIFRDHFLEHSLGFLRATIRAGMRPDWVLALAKGDQTSNRHRVDATLRSWGMQTGVFDNAVVDAAEGNAATLAAESKKIDTFIDRAREAGRKVLVIDDGGLIACGYASVQSARKVDAALELTISGLKRVKEVRNLGIPVLNLAKSELKQRLGYPEIADSCLRRIRTALPGYKIRGRPIVVLGFGSLGMRLADSLRASGGQIHVVDTDIVRLIRAAESGFVTHRSLSEALSRVSPLLIAGTTGETAVKPDDVPLLPDGVFLAPFATKDFSVFASMNVSTNVEVIPGIGRLFDLPNGRSVTLLGDGRSLNLFEADSIPNEGYDAYRAGTLVVAGELCARVDQYNPGVHLDVVDDIVRRSGLYNTYYDVYFNKQRSAAWTDVEERGSIKSGAPKLRAAVIGYGVAGRLHGRILATRAAHIAIVDPKHQNLPGIHQVPDLSQFPKSLIETIDIWSICSPTADHLRSLRTILELNPQARVLLEKPACQAHEILELQELLHTQADARVVVVDQYAHSMALRTMLRRLRAYEPEAPIRHVEITFNKDRRNDIQNGRFIDRAYGVLGYEWPHMITVLRVLLGSQFETYMDLPLARSKLTPTYNDALFLSALVEQTSWVENGQQVSVVLSSNIIEPVENAVFGPIPHLTAPSNWRRGRRHLDHRYRTATVVAGNTSVCVYLDPVTASGGWQLPRNFHRLVVRREEQIVNDEVISDSAMHSAINEALLDLSEENQSSVLDLGSLQRIAALTEYLRRSRFAVACGQS